MDVCLEDMDIGNGSGCILDGVLLEFHICLHK